MKYTAHKTAMTLKKPFSRRMRAARMQRFIDAMGIRGGERIIDLGGSARFWDGVQVPLDITVLNLPDALDRQTPDTHHRITLLEGDACDVTFPDRSFDIAFSNSVIEHVGSKDRQHALAGEARRLAPRYWVQTPSIWFPVEAHTHMPFWWFYPPAMKAHFIRRWEDKLPAWCEMIKGTTVIPRSDMREMFPDARIWTERFMGFAKSYVAYRAD